MDIVHVHRIVAVLGVDHRHRLIQVGAIVTGHVLRVVTAHDRAVALFRGRDQVRGHALLLCVMVFYTLGGIALLMGT